MFKIIGKLHGVDPAVKGAGSLVGIANASAARFDNAGQAPDAASAGTAS